MILHSLVSKIEEPKMGRVKRVEKIRRIKEVKRIKEVRGLEEAIIEIK